MNTFYLYPNYNGSFFPGRPFIFPHGQIVYNNYQYNNNYFNNNNSNEAQIANNDFNIEKKSAKYNSLEYLLSTPQIININNNDSHEYKNKLTLLDFQIRNLNNLKEDLIYLYSSKESLAIFKSSINEEIQFELYKDLDCENFLVLQKERFKNILLISESEIDFQIKMSKLSNFNDSFCYKTSLILENEQTYKKLINVNLISTKIDESFYLFFQKDIKEDRILTYLNELKDVFLSNNIEMESIGLINFNLIEKNLLSIFLLIENKLSQKEDITNLTTFCIICLDLLKNFKSNKLYFYIIQFLHKNNDILDYNQLDSKKEMIQFIPNNCFDFCQLNNNIKKVLINDLRSPLIYRGIIDKNLKKINLNFNDYRTLNYDDCLLLFFGLQNNFKGSEDIYFYFKINLIVENIIDIGKINLLDEKRTNKNIIILDINFSIKKEIIYIFYIFNNSEKYYLKCKQYNKYLMTLLKSDEIKLEKNFIPIRLLNDNKYLYCVSNTNKILMIKKNNRLNYKKYFNCSFYLFENNIMKFREIKDLVPYKMYNSLNINDLIILNLLFINKKFIAKLIIKDDGNIMINLYDIDQNIFNENFMKITYNDNRFIITKLMPTISNDIGVFYDMTSKEFNNLIDKGISLLPFNSMTSNYYSKNLYEYLIQEYSSFVNLCGNFELINAEKEKNLIKYPFSFCCNFDVNYLYFILDRIKEDNTNNNIKLNYIIILKQIVCSLYNTEILNEEKIKNIIICLKKIIQEQFNSKNKNYFKAILIELIEIFSYLKNYSIIEIEEIKLFLDRELNKISFKMKILLFELLLKQNRMKNQIEIYKYIILMEKKYLSDVFITENLDLFKLVSFKRLMINASESLFKRINDIKEVLISLIPNLVENIQILLELFNKKEDVNNKNLKDFSFLYNSFSFRSFFSLLNILMQTKFSWEKKNIYHQYIKYYYY